MADGRLNYVELPCSDVPAARAFYEAAFGWTLTTFGDDYAATTTGDVDLGLNGTPDQQIAAPLPVIQVADLEAAQTRVEAAGGTVTVAVFAFPGGRRFHARDPGGSKIAVMQPD
jgi:predicted enzyme related to lactoylglutathione lyase